jgi:hypothetical protein
MSYDLMVFDPAAAPRRRAVFMRWYHQQTRWTETHGYNNPNVPAAPLRAWFREIVKTFPPMNGPLADRESDSPCEADYSLGESVIYCAFPWSAAKPAREHVKRLAAAHRVGFFDASSSEGALWLPTAGGGFEVSNES